METGVSEISDGSLLRRRGDVVFSQMDGETVMMDAEMESYFGLSKVATYIWNLLEKEYRFGDLIQDLLKAAGDTVTEERCRAETAAFLNDLKGRGFIEVVDPA